MVQIVGEEKDLYEGTKISSKFKKTLGGVGGASFEEEMTDEERQKLQCEKQGGVWDPITKTCRLPGTQDNNIQQQELEAAGDISKVNVDFNPDGTVTYQRGDQPPVTMSREEYNTFKEQQKGIAGGGGRITEGVAAAQAQSPEALAQRQAQLQQQQLLQAIGKIGQKGGLTPAEEAEINFSQALTAGAAGTISGVLGGAAAGAIGGAAVGGIGAIPGAIGGAIVGGVGRFISGTIGNIKEQQRGELQAAKFEMTAARTNMRQLAMLASRDPANADYYISLYNQQLTRVYQAQRQTQLETTGDLNSWINDGRAELAEFDTFLRPGGIADIYGQKLRTPLETGAPLSLTGDQLFLDEEGAI
jgi:hypothetical protein